MQRTAAIRPSTTGLVRLVLGDPSHDSPSSSIGMDLAMRSSKPIIQTGSSRDTAPSTPEQVTMLVDQALRTERMRTAAETMHKLCTAIRLGEGDSSSGSDDDDDDDDDDDEADVVTTPLSNQMKREADQSLASAAPDQKRARGG